MIYKTDNNLFQFAITCFMYRVSNAITYNKKNW